MSNKKTQYPLLSFAIDRGGTFTDIICQIEEADGTKRLDSLKLLSRDPAHYPDAPSEGIKRLLKKNVPGFDSDSLIDHTHVQTIRMGTTVATNALLERNGAKTALVVTQGFKDILEIGNQARPKIFELDIKRLRQLYSAVIEVKERVRVVNAEEQDSAQGTLRDSWRKCHNGNVVHVIQPVNAEEMEKELTQLKEQGFHSIAVCLMNSYSFPDHEKRIGEIAAKVGIAHCSLSSELCSMIKYVPRSTTTAVDGSVTPLITEYISNFRSHFKDNLKGTELLFIQSDGGLCEADAFFGYKAVLSGPAGGVVGCSLCTTHQLGEDIEIVGFDMGGTSTDVCRCEGSKLQHIVEGEIAGTTIQAPQVDVHTVAAGGGSILKWMDGIYCVGPESAGAFPGPSCYGRGGPLTVTDANLILGRIQPQFFPKVFGPNGDQPLDSQATRDKFKELAETICKDLGTTLSVEQIAAGFIEVANEAMCRPIRNLTEARGYRVNGHVLTVFGGAGGQHACQIAKKLGISKIYLHKFASFLSAVGIGLSDVVDDQQSACGQDLEPSNMPIIETLMQGLRESVVSGLKGKGFDQIIVEEYLNLRFAGTSNAIMIKKTESSSYADSFIQKYKQEFGFVLQNRAIVVDDVRVRGLGKAASTTMLLSGKPALNKDFAESAKLEKVAEAQCFFDNEWHATPIYNSREGQPPITGPAILVGNGTTIVVDNHSIAYFSTDGSLVIENSTTSNAIAAAAVTAGIEYDPLTLSVFANRFMSIAEQMGHALQRTSISTNIKERLDFSCAIFDNQGNLVANAPHIPVHLGAMGAAIRYQKEYWGENWVEGETVVSNHPCAGGSHLPDITIMTPFWHQGKVIFYVASRGHHADIGGTTPGSMPPFSKSIAEEGAAIKAFKLVDNKGVFQEDGIVDILMEPGKTEGMSGCRMLPDVLSDLRAQVAANHRGIELVKELIGQFGAEVVTANMVHIQESAARSVRKLLINLAKTRGPVLESCDAMDDGTKIALKVEISESTGDATFDFTKSGDQVNNSTNCPPAVVKSAILYSLRCMIGEDIPLNQGCMEPITVHTRKGSILEPDDDRPVVAGNVLTSQRVTDVILAALGAAASSQGCMNNFLFGNHNTAYYETICGGAGAGPGFHGASAVHTHMTNTRITDPEIFEVRYPVLLRRFELRKGSGGVGKYNGGDGIYREVMFLRPMTISILSERRELAPKGLNGGGEAAKGENFLIPSTASVKGALCQDIESAIEAAFATAAAAVATRPCEGLPGKVMRDVNLGDSILIASPGGGAYGTA